MIKMEDAEIESEMDRENWYFTFGYNHTDKTDMSLMDRFVVIHGTYHSARQELVKRRGPKFAFQYDEKEFGPMAAKYGLREINLSAVTIKKTGTS